ncbi:KH domain-containing protein HEN4 [Selaginella moellendorffii]|uniref:KH domain-containing protein HEN4 n=1 Tax=Selaginella moellendorffii TaxID=88036 RepID=UPI000D1C7493|nr:KH domain-containing protein HEN4 [Selaginella moellendorffii]|eukprot:XP_024518635.1 KH domain-containing protein HEN4 [Selaginella moellendorffii]
MVPMAAGKRSYGHMLMNDPGTYPSSDTSKRHQSSFRRSDSSRGAAIPASQQQLIQQQQEELFRILCPASRIGSVIGKGGSIIKTLRQQTGAKIKIADAIPGSDERVIIIGAFDAEGGGDEDYPAGSGGGAPAALDKDDRAMDEYTNGRDVACPAQLALFKVHSRILDADKYEDDLDDSDSVEEDLSEKVVTRMLVPENQVGCLLGKKGRIIEQMREETGSQIRILPREQLPVCALPTDEVVQVVGDRPSVKRALNAISTRLLDNPPKDRPSSASFQSGNFGGGSRSSGFPASEPYIPQHTSLAPQTRLRAEPRSDSGDNGYQLLRPTAPGLSEFGTGRHLVPMDEELVFRILCPSEKIGNIIGKFIQTLQEETGAKINVPDAVPGCEERVIIVSAVESPDDDLSPAQEAVFHIQDKLRDDGGETSERVVTRLLVPSNHVGCLLGKGGNIISEMRNSTRAIIRVLDREQLPLCALDNDEVVQVLGEIRVARDALVQITSRLRANLYREKTDRSDDYGYQRSTSPLSNFGLQASQPPGIQAPRSPPSWLLQQTERGAYNGLPRLTSYAGIERSYGLAGDRSALPTGLTNLSVVTSTKIDVLIPEVTFSAVLGQNGDNLTQISKMSGAKVTLADGCTATGDRLIEISGTPDQTNIAKTVVEAFAASGNKRS